MDGSAAAPGALVGGLSAAVLVLLLAGTVVALVTGLRGAAPGARFPDDDLPRFRDLPPGVRPAAATPDTAPDTAPPTLAGGAALATALSVAGAPAALRPVRARRPRQRPAVGGALTAVLLLAVAVAAAAVLTARAATAPAAAAPSPVPLDVRARVAAPGLVLSRAPAGVVAAWPTAVLTVHGRRAALHLELPTANCLQPQAPAAPDGSGCLPTGTRAGELTTPALRVTRSGSRLVASGTVPMPTGQRYDVTVALAPSPAGDGTVGNRGTLTVRAAGR